MKKIVIFGAILLILASAGAWFFGRPAYQRHQERQWLRLAETSMQRGEYQAAATSARQVLKRNPESVPACKINVRLAEISGSSDLLAWRQRLAELEPSAENHLALASCALRLESPPYPLATKTLEELRASAGNEPGFHVVSAERALRLRDLAEAERHLQQAAQLQPSNHVHAINLAVLRLQSADAKLASGAREELRALSNEPSVSLQALRALLADNFRRGDGAAALDISQRILTHTNSAFTDHVQHLTVLHMTRSPDFQPYQKSLQQRAGTNLAHVAELASWWNARGLANESVRVLKGLPASQRNQPPIPLLLADAYMLQKEWRTLQKWLRSANWGDQEYMRLAILARAARAEGDNHLAEVDWNRAMQGALDRTHTLSSLLATAQLWGWTNEVERLLWQAAKKYTSEQWPLRALEKTYLAAGNSRGLLNVYSTRLDRQPQDPLAKNDLAAVSLLLKTDLKRAHALARDAFTQSQTNPAAVSTYAFSLYLQGKTKEGLEVMNQLQEAERRHPSIAAYYALLLSKAGETDEAQAYRSLAERGTLLPEERLLLQR